jgi:BASS family bile acid:Na+ symporter
LLLPVLKSVLILIALAGGLLLPQLEAYTFTLRPFLMTLLFFAFLNVRIDRGIFSRWQAVAAALLLPMGLLVYYLGRSYEEDLGLTLLLMGLAPTAVITPVLAQIMRRDVGYTVGAILVTHACFALTVPLLLPLLLGIDLSVSSLARLVYTIGGTVAGPLVLAQLVRRLNGPLLRGLRAIGPYTFVLFLSNITVAAGSLSHYLRNESSTPWSFVAVTTGAIGLLMLVNFGLGSQLAPKRKGIEGSLALGRKNTMLSIWIALEYINPLVVLGPMLYILLQNVFVAGQIVYVERRQSEPVPLQS